MAVGDLSPWPPSSASASLTAARDALRSALGASLTDDQVDRFGEAAAAMVEGYCAEAPQPLKNEAVLRTAGYLREMPSAAIRNEDVGPMSRAYATTHVSALRHSGAMALLSPFKVRRAPS